MIGLRSGITVRPLRNLSSADVAALLEVAVFAPALSRVNGVPSRAVVTVDRRHEVAQLGGHGRVQSCPSLRVHAVVLPSPFSIGNDGGAAFMTVRARFFVTLGSLRGSEP